MVARQDGVDLLNADPSLLLLLFWGPAGVIAATGLVLALRSEGCPRCAGAGRLGRHACPDCGGKGRRTSLDRWAAGSGDEG